MCVALLLTALCSAPAEAREAALGAADTVLVCPEEYLDTLRPYLTHRARQGHRFALVSNTQSAEKIRDAVRETAQGGKLRYVVLVGDAEPAGALDKDVRSR